jgi:hypothetical protein
VLQQTRSIREKEQSQISVFPFNFIYNMGPIWPATYKITVYMPTVQKLYLTCKINKKLHVHILTLMNVNLSVWLV